MGFKNKSFDEPVYQQQEKEPTKVIIISCEGSNTEPEYFKTIKEKLADNISSLVEIEIVSKGTEASEPLDVFDNLQKHVEKYDFNKGFDSLWLVCDREKVIDRKSGKKGLLTVIPKCHENGYSMALTNPLFEFWLLLHVADITEYNHETLFNNEKTSPAKRSRRYIDKQLSEILDGGYSKKTGRFNRSIVTLENIKKAINQEIIFENELEKIVDNLGCNVSGLVKEVLDLQE
ncbi:RloB family protein [Vibrio parahaemolyticus]|uniref:RloB family protein n=1 Tax=Vibrio parahaemolyticus TaxID=670 RepID=UPI0003FD7276|nr:RloB family protein [Vibrio parahaemolyticus]